MLLLALIILAFFPFVFCDSSSEILNLCQPGMFAMTFDQGPSIYTGAVLDAFDANNCKATFHPVVSFLEQPTIVANLQRAYSTGHLVGFSIEPGIDLSSFVNPDDLLALFADRASKIQRATGSPRPPIFVRIPGLSNLTGDQISTIVNSGGYVISTYNLDSYDYSSNGTAILSSFKNVLDLLSPNTKGGFISVQRDYVQESVMEVPDIISYIQKKGYTLVTLDKCFPGGNIPGHPSGSKNTTNTTAPVSSSSFSSIDKKVFLEVACFILGLLALF